MGNTDEEYMVTTPTTYAHIRTVPSVCGGLAHVAGTRVRVIDVVTLHDQGRSPEEIRASYEHLTLGQIHAVLAYAHDHPEEVEADHDRSRHAEEEFRRDHPHMVR